MSLFDLHHKILLSVSITLLFAGCNPTYAPAIRAAHYGAPGHLDQGQVELGATAGGVALPLTGGPNIAIGLRDWATIEFGGNLSTEGQWAMGYVGSRFSASEHRDRPYHLLFDAEAGVGGGGGGDCHTRDSKTQESRPCDQLGLGRLAFGGYQGFGFGYQFNWFSLYGRMRLEESKATNVPTTIWPSAMLGMEFNIKRRAAINLGGGFMAYHNDAQDQVGWFYQVGVSFFFDAFKRSAKPSG
jgi:hypothetical protein